MLSQTTQDIQVSGEKKPTSRDPRYKIQMLPPKIKKQLEKGPGSGSLLLNPSGTLSDAEVRQMMQKDDEKKAKLSSRQWQQDARDIPGGEERVLLEKSILRQFGMESVPYRWREPPEYKETPLRRFQITFFLSAPITLGFSYIIASGIKSAYGESPTVFTGPQTAGMVFAGIAGAVGIGWYDLNQWEKTRSEKVSDLANESDHSFRVDLESRNILKKRHEYASISRVPGHYADYDIFQLRMRFLWD